MTSRVQPKKKYRKLTIPSHLKELNWVCNLEGALEHKPQGLLRKTIVFNDFEALKSLKNEFKIAAVTLANNHITDSSTIPLTKEALVKLEIAHVGAGKDLNDASSPIYLKDQGQNITLLNFGWRSIDCDLATNSREGVNPYSKEYVITEVLKSKKEFPDNKLILFFHWNYELELYPQPHDRELSKFLIDIGADAIIGCHAHRVQGAEIYKGKPIIYGLGNWLFTPNAYWNGHVKFPEFCNLELAFEIDWIKEKYICHWFNFDPKENSLIYLESEELSVSKRIKERSPFSTLSSKQYKKWFLQNRIQKKLLPVFYFEDSQFKISIKNMWIQFRHLIIVLLVKIKLKN